jgi:hypothetical protein
MLDRAIDWAVEHDILCYGPYNQLFIADRVWPLCVAVMAALVLLAAYIEHGTVIV